MSHSRKKGIKKLDNKGLRKQTHSNFDAAFDRVIAAMRNMDEGNYEKAMDHIHRTAEHLTELRALNNETRKRYQKAMYAGRQHKKEIKRITKPFWTGIVDRNLGEWLNLAPMGDMMPVNCKCTKCGYEWITADHWAWFQGYKQDGLCWRCRKAK